MIFRVRLGCCLCRPYGTLVPMSSLAGAGAPGYPMPPLRGCTVIVLSPTAYAVGFILPPLRGFGVGTDFSATQDGSNMRPAQAKC
jgi:hypothetical protein